MKYLKKHTIFCLLVFSKIGVGQLAPSLRRFSESLHKLSEALGSKPEKVAVELAVGRSISPQEMSQFKSFIKKSAKDLLSFFKKSKSTTRSGGGSGFGYGSPGSGGKITDMPSGVSRPIDTGGFGAGAGGALASGNNKKWLQKVIDLRSKFPSMSDDQFVAALEGFGRGGSSIQVVSEGTGRGGSALGSGTGGQLGSDFGGKVGSGEAGSQTSGPVASGDGSGGQSGIANVADGQSSGMPSNVPQPPLSGPPPPGSGPVEKTALTKEDKNASDRSVITLFKQSGRPVSAEGISKFISLMVNNLKKARVKDPQKQGALDTSGFKKILEDISKVSLVSLYNDLLKNKLGQEQLLINIFAKTFLFDSSLVNSDNEILTAAKGIIINLAAIKRKENKLIDDPTEEQKKASDAQFINAIEEVTQDQYSDLATLLNKINLLRINETYLKYPVLEEDIGNRSEASIASQSNDSADKSDMKALFAEIAKAAATRVSNQTIMGIVGAINGGRVLQGMINPRSKSLFSDVEYMSRYLYYPLDFERSDEIAKKVSELRTTSIDVLKAMDAKTKWESDQKFADFYFLAWIQQFKNKNDFFELLVPALDMQSALKNFDKKSRFSMLNGDLLLQLKMLDGKKHFVLFKNNGDFIDKFKKLQNLDEKASDLDFSKAFLDIAYDTIVADAAASSINFASKILLKINTDVKTFYNDLKGTQSALLRSKNLNDLINAVDDAYVSGLLSREEHESVIKAIYSLGANSKTISEIMQLFVMKQSSRERSLKSYSFAKDLGRVIDSLFKDSVSGLYFVTKQFSINQKSSLSPAVLIEQYRKALEGLSSRGSVSVGDKAFERGSEVLKKEYADHFAEIFGDPYSLDNNNNNVYSVASYFEALHALLVSDFPLKDFKTSDLFFTSLFEERKAEFGKLVQQEAQILARLFLGDIAQRLNYIRNKQPQAMLEKGKFVGIPGLEITAENRTDEADKVKVYGCIKDGITKLVVQCNSVLATESITKKEIDQLQEAILQAMKPIQTTSGSEGCKDLPRLYREAAFNFLNKIRNVFGRLIYELPVDVKKAMEEAKSSKVATEKKN